MTGENAVPASGRRKREPLFFGNLGDTGVDRAFLTLVLILLVLGLVTMYSASHCNAYYYEGDSFHYIFRQLVFAALGLAVMSVFSRVNYRALRRFAWILFPVTVALLVAVFFMPGRHEAHRWIFLGRFQFQPSEIAKFSMVLLFAHLLTSNRNRLHRFRYGVLPFGVVFGCYAALVLTEPHISASILLAGIAAMMLTVGGLPKKWIAAGAALLVLLVLLVRYVPGLHERAAFRIAVWKDPEGHVADGGYQVLQSLYAIGSGGLMGRGFGGSGQKHLFLPELQNDFIFSIYCEEFGFVGALLVITLFVLFICRGVSIALRARDRFGSMLVIGFTAQVGLQALLNMAVVTNAVPTTGISLPFFSYGGSALVILLAEMGIILSVSRRKNGPEESGEAGRESGNGSSDGKERNPS